MIRKNSTIKCTDCGKIMYKIKIELKTGEAMNSGQLERGDGKAVMPYHLIQCWNCKLCYSPNFIGNEKNWTEPLILEVK